ncbi:MAG: hypothetical protein ABIH83_04280 [Candidatus Micrarchaeota archaeon]
MTNSGADFLMTAPEHDNVTFYCARWSKEVAEEARRKNLNVAVLSKEKANQAEFEGRLKKIHASNFAEVKRKGL